MGAFSVAAVVFFVLVMSWMTQRSWRQVAADLDFHLEKSLVLGPPRLNGEYQDFSVEIFTSDKKVTIDVHGVDPGFTIGRDSAMARLIKPDIETGDTDFDDRIRIEGDADFALAVLREETRKTVEIVVTHNEGSVSDGRIRCTVRGVRTAPSTLDSMVQLAKELRRPSLDELPARLAHSALHDASLGVRLQAFRQLASSFYRADELRRTARALRKTWDAPLEIEACRVLLREPEPEGAEAAEELLKLARRQHLDSSLRRTALEAVARSAFRKLAVPTLAELLRDPAEEPAELRRAAITGLAKAGAVGELLTVRLSDDPVETELLARSLGKCGDASVQSRLLRLLDHPEDRVRIAAAGALGDVGDVGAVEPLLKLSSGLLQLAVGRAADAAIAKIQKRAGGSQAGEISLAAVSPLEGAVSRADESGDAETPDGGEVSLA